MQVFDVVVVGAGMVGSLFVAGLADSGLRIALIDGQEPQKPDVDGAFEPRVSALTRAAENMLQRVGALAMLEETRLCRFSDMDVWEADGTGHIHFSAHDVGETHLGLMIENRLLQWALTYIAKAQSNVSFLCPASLEHLERLPNEWQLTLNNGEKLNAKLVIGADGALSRVRAQVGINTREKDYGQRAIVTTVRCESSHELTAWQRFLPTGPVAFLPLKTRDGDDTYCSIVWTADSKEAERILQLDDAAFCREIGFAFEHRLGRVLSADKRFSFPLIARHAEEYTRDGLALIGDAAHAIHPLAGQGVNLGLLDAAVLVEEIKHALSRGLGVDEPSALRRYSRRRRGHNLLMLHTMTGFQKLFGADDLGLRLVRNTGLRVVNQLAPVKNHIVREAMGLAGELPELAKMTTSVD